MRRRRHLSLLLFRKSACLNFQSTQSDPFLTRFRSTDPDVTIGDCRSPQQYLELPRYALFASFRQKTASLLAEHSRFVAVFSLIISTDPVKYYLGRSSRDS